MNCSKKTIEEYKSLSTKTGVSGGINVNASGSRNLTFHVNTTDKSTCSKASKGFSAGVEVLLTEAKVQHALKTAIAYRTAYDIAKANGKVFDYTLFDNWKKRYLYAPELEGQDTPFGKGITIVKKFPVTLMITGSKKITKSLGECLASSLNGSLIKCVAPHKNNGARAQTLGESPLVFVIGEGCEVA